MLNASLKSRMYSGLLFSFPSTFSQLSCISIGLTTGSNACASNVKALPSQLKLLFHPRFINAEAFLVPWMLSIPVLNWLGSEKEELCWWHVIQAWVLLALRIGSLNNFYPRETPSMVIGLFSGIFISGKPVGFGITYGVGLK